MNNAGPLPIELDNSPALERLLGVFGAATLMYKSFFSVAMAAHEVAKSSFATTTSAQVAVQGQTRTQTAARTQKDRVQTNQAVE